MTEQTSPEHDVAVIGAGAAGITVARRLSEAGRRVILIEGGGLDPSTESQNMYHGEATGIPYPLIAARLRFFGGTTNHWHGYCRPLDEADFRPRATIGYPGWPIPYSELDTYLPEAMAILDLDPASSWMPTETNAFTNKVQASELDGINFLFSRPPTRFKDKYLSSLQQDPNVTIVTEETLVDLAHENGWHISGAVVENLTTGVERTIRAKAFVLACGGIENARLLLHINRQQNTTFGDESGALGRYFMEHPHFYIVGRFVVTDPDYDGSQDVNFLRLAPNVVQQARIMNCSLRMSLINDRPDVLRELRELTHLPHPESWQLGRLDIISEQEPNPNNRVTLSDQETDRLGIPRAVLHWEMSERDYQTVFVGARKFAEFMLTSGTGRCKLEPWVLQQSPPKTPEPGWHHMGTTRMATSARDGVVDTNCRLYGTENVFVAGSSVFPTSGYANPTLGIVQMALRLGDHLQQTL